MTIKRKLPGESVSILGNNGDDEPTAQISSVEWAKLIGQIQEDNPGLPNSFIEAILVALEEEKAGKLLEYSADDPE